MFDNITALKPDIARTVRSMEKTYSDAAARKGGNVTFRALPPSDTDFYGELDLTKFDFSDGLEYYADTLCKLLSQSFRVRTVVDDNMIPSVSPVLGIGDYSAFVAGGIAFAPDTSWSTPVLRELSDFRKLAPIGEALWYGRFLHICELLLRRSASAGIPFMRGFFSPLDLLAALRGDAIYTDFYDDPDTLHEALSYCADCTIRFAEDIYALAERYLGNTEYGMFFLRGNINMSEDIACMISGELYREFCAPHTQRVIDAFGRGHMHCHSRAMYLVKEICSLNNVVHLWLASDPGQPRPIDSIERLVEDANGVCLAIDCENFGEIESNYSAMKEGNFSVCLPVSDVAEAVSLTKRFNSLSEKE